MRLFFCDYKIITYICLIKIIEIMGKRNYNTAYGAGGRKNPERPLLSLVTLSVVLFIENFSPYGW